MNTGYSDRFPDAKPVPKEGEDITRKKDQQKQIPDTQIAGEPLVVHEETVTEKIPVPLVTEDKNVPIPVEPEPAINFPETDEKKRRFNPSFFCMGSCFTSIILTISLALILVFKPSEISSILNSIFNSNLYIPEVTEESVEDVSKELLAVKSGSVVVVSEDEFNNLLKENLRDQGANIDLVGDFEKDSARLLVKFEHWMPWSIIELSGSGEGEIKAENVKLGPFDMNNYVENKISDNLGTQVSFEQFDFKKFFEAYLFESNEEEINLSKIIFLNDEIKIIVE